MSDEASADKSDNKAAIPLAIVGVMLAGLMLWAFVGGDGDSEPDESAIRRDAERVCEEDFIAPRLKSPSSAESDLSASGGPVTYTVTGTVDAENSFGAMLRSNVTCIVRLGDDEWTLVSVSGIN